jgi:hypothetical protein
VSYLKQPNYGHGNAQRIHDQEMDSQDKISKRLRNLEGEVECVPRLDRTWPQFVESARGAEKVSDLFHSIP